MRNNSFVIIIYFVINIDIDQLHTWNIYLQTY